MNHSFSVFSDEHYMRLALKEAQKAFELGEIPVGAVIVGEQQILAKAHNQTEALVDVTAHAEILAITAAEQQMGSKYLKNCTLYVTLEPCVMCAGALAWSQIGRIVFAARDEKRGFQKLAKDCLHPKTVVESGLLEFEAKALIQDFFKQRR
jgi:tRNA(adenine34) deaminase